MIPDILMALFGPWIYGEPHVSAYFNVFSGASEPQNRLDNTPVTTPTTESVVSDAAFANMAERFPTPVIRPFG
ncbi:MAG: hypothetical protein LRY54_02845 [Alphaproteobacteria bacterium]|nr:hypothetical protein [Alphaproteobacteria bacterium]